LEHYIFRFARGQVVDVGLLDCDAVWTRMQISTFRRKSWGKMFLRNIGIYLKVQMALQPRKPAYISSWLWEPELSYIIGSLIGYSMNRQIIVFVKKHT